MSRWTEAEHAYLVEHYADAPIEELSAYLGRSLGSIYCRAKESGLKRKNGGKFDGTRITGKRFEKGHTVKRSSPPWNKGTRPPTLTAKVFATFVSKPEQTIGALSAVTGSPPASCWRACDALRAKRLIHIARYEAKKNTWQAVYRFGEGQDAPYPDQGSAREPEDDPYQIQPVPNPVLGFWHERVFNITHGATGAGKEQAAA